MFSPLAFLNLPSIRGILILLLILMIKEIIPSQQMIQRPKELKMERSNHLMFYLLLVLVVTAWLSYGDTRTTPFHVGPLLDLDTLVGKMGRTSISMAIDDFYDLNRNYTTRVVLHSRNTNNDVVQAAAGGIYSFSSVPVPELFFSHEIHLPKDVLMLFPSPFLHISLTN